MGDEGWRLRGVGANETDRWRKVLNSGCREGREMQKVWGKISIDAQCCTNYLEEELPEVLATWLPGLGNGSVNGSTRSKVVEAREHLITKVLNKVLEAV